MVVGFRPENLSLVKVRNGVKVNGVVEITEMLGDTMNIYVSVGESKIIIRTSPTDKYDIGDTIEFFINQDYLHIFDANTELAIR